MPELAKVVISLVTIVIAAAASRAQTAALAAPSIVCTACRSADAPTQATPFSPRRTILGQHFDVALPQIAHQAGTKPIVIQTPRVTIVSAVDGGPVDDLSGDEVDHLRATFPALGPRAPAILDAHQVAHVLAARTIRLEADLRKVLDLDDGGRVRPESGPSTPVSSNHVEVFVFGAKAGADTFTSFIFDRGVWPLGGAMLDSAPTCAVVVPSLKDAAARRQFSFATSMVLLHGLSRAGSGLQGWLKVGLAHVIEDRHAGRPGRNPESPTLPPGSEVPKDWDALVADLVTGGKVGDLGALAATPTSALSVRSRVQAWSLVKFMIEEDPKRFAALVRTLLHASPADAPPKSLLAALRPAFEHDLVTLTEAWKAWVRKGRAAK